MGSLVPRTPPPAWICLKSPSFNLLFCTCDALRCATRDSWLRLRYEQNRLFVRAKPKLSPHFIQSFNLLQPKECLRVPRHRRVTSTKHRVKNKVSDAGVLTLYGPSICGSEESVCFLTTYISLILQNKVWFLAGVKYQHCNPLIKHKHAVVLCRPWQRRC